MEITVDEMIKKEYFLCKRKLSGQQDCVLSCDSFHNLVSNITVTEIPSDKNF